MTVEVGILNKYGVALAADSAVTVGNGRGYYNTANKMFSLSKYEPVAIMIYSNSEFMGIPMETIIKEYRRNLGKKSFKKLEAYWNDFLKFLKQFSKEKVPNKEYYYLSEIYSFLNSVFQEINTILDNNTEEYDTKEELDNKISSVIEDTVKHFSNSLNALDDDTEYKNNYDELEELLSEKIKKIILDIFTDTLNEDLEQKLIEASIMIITKKHDMGSRTGIVITGFGTEEIYPSLISGEFMFMCLDKLKYSQKNNYEIEKDGSGAMFPFAQSDVINTFFCGIDSSIINSIMNTLDNSSILSGCNNSSECREKLKSEILTSINKSSVENHSDPMINTIAIAPKEELAQMAETLANLTSFRRKLSLDQYTQTVGGPIDVLLITKGDGLVWIKRKLYFDKELNYNFYHNYYK